MVLTLVISANPASSNSAPLIVREGHLGAFGCKKESFILIVMRANGIKEMS